MVIDMLISNIGRKIDESPFKNEYVMNYMEVSRNTLSNWRTGKTYPPIEKAFKLSRLLGCSVEDLFIYKEDN
jgi:putative transcriptional regulator